MSDERACARPLIAHLVTRGERRLAAASDTARLDAEVLLGHVLGQDRSWVLAHWEDPAPAEAEAALAPLLERRARGEPVAYLRGFKEFMGTRFVVDRRVLIPRPETEHLVEAARDWLLARGLERPLAADVGTGSGAVAISLALAVPHLHVFATDDSAEALEVARLNAEALGVADRVTLRRGHLLESLPRGLDLVVANLPYLRDDELPSPGSAPTSLDFEPRSALAGGGPEGTALIEECLAQLPGYLRTAGAALLEIGPGQAERLCGAASRAFPLARLEVFPDYGGRPRVLAVYTA